MWLTLILVANAIEGISFVSDCAQCCGYSVTDTPISLVFRLPHCCELKWESGMRNNLEHK